MTAHIVVAPHFRPRPRLRHALLDWDGTLSLLRGGWVETIVDLCLEHLPAHPGECVETLRRSIHAEVLALNGKPSIHHMGRIAELVTARTGASLHADDYQRLYVERITAAIEQRVSGILAGQRSRESVMVPGARQLLEALQNRGLDLSLVSGTPYPELVEEAALLEVNHHFDVGIYGPRDTSDRDFSKRAALHAIVAEHRFSGDELVAIGDGPVEISEIKALGGLAIAVAFDESAPGDRRFDKLKREQLLNCGADLVVPDFLDAESLLRVAMGQ